MVLTGRVQATLRGDAKTRPWSQEAPASVGKRSNFTITFYSQPIPASARTRQCAFSFGMSLWSKTRAAAKPSLRSKYVENAVLAIARARRERCIHLSG